ncbi:MAG TPA: RNA polymerase-associated protein RapA [Pseudomonadales bacterium]|nr:RNA polymerase-associated protein RapA [Pseudomonadales bacterium]
MQYIVGQRWISEPEPALGLGIIIHVDARLVEIAFPAKEIVRSYAKRNAPLARVTFDLGEEIRHKSGGLFRIIKQDEQAGLLYYQVEASGNQPTLHELFESIPDYFCETELHAHLQFNSPDSRFYCGQIDKNRWFDLRYRTLRLHADWLASPCRGFIGPRLALIPHQFHIAQQVSSRHAPRVLLADEVGLGKTIEAGLILHQQHCAGIVTRALVIVPENLQHQWLVEMARRFNLLFSIFDEERCQTDDEQNPFESEQLVLCSLNFLLAHPQRHAQLLAAHWDMLIVDEAHHLSWSEAAPSAAYLLVEQLAKAISSVLLLTATPEQFGPEGHFARLKLLDPQRFHDLAIFLEEEKQYQKIAQFAQALVNGRVLDNDMETELKTLLDVKDVLAYQKAAKTGKQNSEEIAHHLLTALIDRHGTGRILFRNIRKNISGFPGRKLKALPCPLPTQWQDTPNQDLHTLLYPETQNQADSEQWWHFDPRFQAIVTLLKQHRGEKFVLICAHASTVQDIDTGLRIKHGIHAAVFYEQQTLIERDRAAAFFADADENCQILLCSEIGSEGRNFQFAHHLILFDLPLHPDLLEQRIGRLDRIGQRQDIQIHVPYFSQHAQQKLFNWYHQALNAFEKTNTTGAALYSRYETRLTEFLLQPSYESNFDAFIAEAQQANQDLIKQLEEGRDPLLELNSSSRDLPLLEQLSAVESDNTLQNWLTHVFDLYGVSHEEGSQYTLIAHPSEHMRIPQFPGLPEEGITLSFDRACALAREDLQFITLDHPMVNDIIELIIGQEKGNTALATLKLPNVREGAFLLETLFTLEPMAPAIYQINSYLPLKLIRLLTDDKGTNLAEKVSFEQLAPRLTQVPKETARTLVKAELSSIKALLKQARAQAESNAEQLRQQAHQAAVHHLNEEAQRLAALKKKNPLIRQSEIDFMKEKTEAVLQHIAAAPLHLQAMRLIITI